MSAAFAVSVARGRGGSDAFLEATAAGDSRSPALFASVRTRYRTENRPWGALLFFKYTLYITKTTQSFFSNKRFYNIPLRPIYINFCPIIFEGFKDIINEKSPRAIFDAEVFLIKMACRLGGRSGNGQ